MAKHWPSPKRSSTGPLLGNIDTASIGRGDLAAAGLRKRLEAEQSQEAVNSDIGCGHQIRSYVFDQSRVLDLRTNVEVQNGGGEMEGDLDIFVEASLKQGV